MIIELKLKNFAIIDDISINFTDGLNIITGETGTGKSIIIDAISIILGGKFNNEYIKSGKEESTVEALFNLPESYQIGEKLNAHGIETFDNELIIKRAINRKNKSKIYINGSISNLKILKIISEGLVDIFGQHEHQKLLKKSNYIGYLDQYSNIISELSNYQEIYHKFLSNSKQLESLMNDKQKSEDKSDYFKFQLDEISEANLLPNEEQLLEEEQIILSNSEKFNSSINEAIQSIYESNSSVLGLLKKSVDSIQRISGLDKNIDNTYKRLNDISLEVEDIYYTLREFKNNIVFNPERLEEILERLELIKRLKRKYGDSIPAILTKKEEIEQELSQIIKYDELLDNLTSENMKLKKDVYNLANELSKKRVQAGVELEKSFCKETESVGLKGAYLKVDISDKEPGLEGKDIVDYLFTANPDQAPKSINKVASGGELSRIMLVLRSFIVDEDSGSILIFDEADSGIGGFIAETIGQKIKNLAKNNQIICITHLPQVAKYAENHLLVTKTISNDITEVIIVNLDETDRIKEISRMIAGSAISEKTIEVAKELINSAG